MNTDNVIHANFRIDLRAPKRTVSATTAEMNDGWVTADVIVWRDDELEDGRNVRRVIDHVQRTHYPVGAITRVVELERRAA